MRTITAAFLASTMLISSAMAAQDSSAPLPAGKPAGVHKANIAGTPFFWVLGLAFLGAGIGIASSGNGGNNPTNSTSSTAP